ncbi:MAG: Asp-tRNA(Asn)/Glu-tRNA(Gln) amidotransferase subunit GatC [Gemmatimonadota bacterium]
MAITIEDVRHIAALARLGMTDERATVIVGELNTILSHMDALSQVKTEGVQEAIGVGARGLPTRSDSGPPMPLERALHTFAPSVREGFLLVPRLSTHESPADA